MKALVASIAKQKQLRVRAADAVRKPRCFCRVWRSEQSRSVQQCGATWGASDGIVTRSGGLLFLGASQASSQVQALCDGPSFVGKQRKASGGLFITVVVAGPSEGCAGCIARQLRDQERIECGANRCG